MQLNPRFRFCQVQNFSSYFFFSHSGFVSGGIRSKSCCETSWYEPLVGTTNVTRERLDTPECLQKSAFMLSTLRIRKQDHFQNNVNFGSNSMK